MFFTLDVRRARKGDCLILHFGSPEDPGLALIDGGPPSVYQPHLKPRRPRIRNPHPELRERRNQRAQQHHHDGQSDQDVEIFKDFHAATNYMSVRTYIPRA